MLLLFYRKERNLSQTVLASMLNVTQSSVSYWETGLRLPSYSDLIKLSLILDCSVNDLIADDIEKIKKEFEYEKKG